MKKFGCHLQITDRFINLAINHNRLGSLRDIFWLLTIVWSNCEKVIVYSRRWHYMIYSTDWWTFFDTVEEKVHSHIAYYVVTFFLKITDSRPWGAGITIILHVIWSVHLHQQVVACHTNHKTFKICINGMGTLLFLRVIWVWKLFWANKHKHSLGEFMT